MPTINPLLVPTVTPGSLFEALTQDDTLNIRWFTNRDPVFYSVLNRPIADLALRQLILAKAMDNLEASLGHAAIFPFLIQPRIADGSTAADVPLNWIWDINLSLPAKWSNTRLAKIKRISGTNDDGTDDNYTGKLRLIFTGVQTGSATETALVYVDYDIESSLTYQIARVTTVGSGEEAVYIDSGESETVSGFVVFKTLDTTLSQVQAFLDILAAPDDTTADTDGLYADPSVYEIVDSAPGDSSGDFSATAVSHGTGMLAATAVNPIPSLDSDVQSWVNAFNFPFDSSANRTSTLSIIIPVGIFREFDITAPAGDEPEGDSSGDYFPVWISRIERTDDASNSLRFYFSTYNVTETETGGNPSTEAVEFAIMDLTRDMEPGDVVSIVPNDNLFLKEGSDADLWGQHIGRGHAVLSSQWDGTSTVVDDFFNEFALISDDPADTIFSKTSTRISSFGISRVPKYTPTIGQARALLGSTSRRSTPVNPSASNRYVTEEDQGLGDAINLESQSGITPHQAIGATGYTGSLCHRVAKLEINGTLIDDESTEFYEDHILPRLRILFGRDPAFGDIYYNGTRFMMCTGDAWQSLG